MPKRRTRVKCLAKEKSENSKGSSSEDMDMCSVIVRRLSKKYLLKSSTDTEQSDHKENTHGKSDPYDADLESSEVDTAPSIDTSDMECLDKQPNILSPSRSVNVAPTGKAKPKRARRGDPSRLMRPAPEQVKLRSSSRQVKLEALTSVSGMTSYRSATMEESSPRQHSDSGLFVSPPTDTSRRHLPKLNVSDTSTPASAVCDVHSDQNDSCFGFDSLILPDPLGPMSPVDLIISPIIRRSSSRRRKSHHVEEVPTMKTKMVLYTESPAKRKAEVALDRMSSVCDEEPLKKVTKKKKIVNQKLQAMQNWAADMAEQFHDIEMHELNIE